MTGLQKDRTLGVEASKNYRAIKLTVEGTANSFMAHIPPAAPDGSQFSLGDNEREASRIFVLRPEVPPGIGFGTYLIDLENNRRHRVAEILDHPTDIWVVFTAETVPQT